MLPGDDREQVGAQHLHKDLQALDAEASARWARMWASSRRIDPTPPSLSPSIRRSASAVSFRA